MTLQGIFWNNCLQGFRFQISFLLGGQRRAQNFIEKW